MAERLRVVAAMSGGVDSSVAAAILVEQGHDVIGVHMKLHDTQVASTSGKHCCGLDDALDARRVCDRLGIPFYVMDLQQAFRVAVMDYFADAYLAGATPNPCVPCNGVLRFQILLARARALGASHVATGHYARLDGGGALRMAADRQKDQTYFLFPVSTEALAASLFPLGELTKPMVRARAADLGLVTANKPESQEICFIPDDDHTRFVREHRPGADGSGDIVDEDGKILGVHDGYWRFTVGQRRGIGVAMGRPAYVLGIDPETRRVVVGGGDRLAHHGVLATRFNWLRQPEGGLALHARIRHRGQLIPARVALDGADPNPATVRVDFTEPARAATKGQAVVLYARDELIGGGWIDRVYA